MDADVTEVQAEIVELPPTAREPVWIPLIGCEIVVGLILWSLLMQGDIARLWTKVKEKRATERQTANDDIAALRKQIQEDALNDDDRAAIEEIRKEAGE